MPRQPRLDAFRSSSGTFGPALRPGSSTGALHHVMLRRIERRARQFGGAAVRQFDRAEDKGVRGWCQIPMRQERIRVQMRNRKKLSSGGEVR